MLPWLYGITICLSATLMFFIQPLLAKAMLPYFGGSGFVWIACILFFQIALLLGYAYAYFLAKYLSYPYQVMVHIVLILCSCFFLPIALHINPAFSNHWPPFVVLLSLTSTIMVPFVVLSATSPLLQHWYYRIEKSSFPYVFYSVSNFGSLVGLLGFPLLLEPLIGIKTQMSGWTLLYGVYLIGLTFCSVKLLMIKHEGDEVTTQQIPLTIKNTSKWLLLTFLSSTLLLSITLFLVQNVMNMPLLWVIPLALYLISFIIVFSKEKAYDRTFWYVSFIIWIMLTAWLIFHNQMAGFNVVIVLLALLFSACMVCHGELIQARPQQADLTVFYLFIAVGGALGGIFVNLIATFFFTQWWDLYIPLFIINVIIFVVFYHQMLQSSHPWNKGLCIVSLVSIGILAFVVIGSIINQQRGLVAQFRNPFGIIKVVDHQGVLQPFRALLHGKVLHGTQFFDDKSQMATTYYGMGTGIGDVMQYLESRSYPLNIGIIGLGTGTMAAWTRKGDHMHFYDIDKDIKKVALRYFTYLSHSPAKIIISIGDARVQMQNEFNTQGSAQYNLIVVDAFSGDAIPAHLLTAEAIKLYANHLAKNGIIAFHTSNSYLNFKPLTKALSEQQQCPLYWIENSANEEIGIESASWAIITCDPNFSQWLQQQKITVDQAENVRPLLWTDDLNTILPLLRWDLLR